MQLAIRDKDMYQGHAARAARAGWCVLVACSLALAVGCDDGPPPAKDKDEAKDEPKAKAAPPPGPAPRNPKLPAENTRLVLSEKDFTERDDNRDPFRSFIQKFAAGPRRGDGRQRKVVMRRYALDEITLIAVVTGSIRPRAMFRDPKGLGITVKRGDYISKSEGRVKQILVDKVIVEIEEKAENTSRRSDRVILLRPRGEQSPLQGGQ